MKGSVISLILLALAGASWGETYEGSLMSVYTDGEGYFRYTSKERGLGRITLISSGVYEITCSEGWDCIIEQAGQYTVIELWPTGSCPSMGTILELYSTCVNAEPRPILAYSCATGRWIRVFEYTPSCEEIPPIEQVDRILQFVDSSVAEGVLDGVGSGNSAKNKLNAFVNMLKSVQGYIEAEDYDAAYDQLIDALKKCDGQVPPPDFVDGEAREELANMIMELMETLVEEE